MTIVVLAAGASRRMGRQKLLEPIGGTPMIRRVLAAAADWPTLVVASPAVAEALVSDPPPGDVRVVRNDEPERGMNRSLSLADAALPPDEPVAVLLGDLPDCDAATIRRVLAAYDDAIDVVAPRAGERFGHPVVFGPRARRRIAALGEGDGLNRLRDDPALHRRVVPLEDPRVFADIDTEEELAARRARD